MYLFSESVKNLGYCFQNYSIKYFPVFADFHFSRIGRRPRIRYVIKAYKPGGGRNERIRYGALVLNAKS